MQESGAVKGQLRLEKEEILSLLLTAKSFQSCPTLCDPIDGSPPGSSIHGIFQASALEWVAIAFSELLLLL